MKGRDNMKPILFNTDMVRAILDGRKTVTRRVVKPQLKNVLLNGELVPHSRYGRCLVIESEDSIEVKHIKPPYRPGDILYVRETFGTYNGNYYLYRADYPDGAKTYDFDGHRCDLPCWRPSIHMPREAARIFLRVTGVRVERLQKITDEQINAEGLRNTWQHYNFGDLWDGTIKPADRARYGWAANPFVFVISFERILKDEAMQQVP